MAKKLVIVDSSKPDAAPESDYNPTCGTPFATPKTIIVPPKTMSEKEMRRRNRPIKALTLYKQGPYEIEMASPRNEDDKEPVTFHCVVPYTFPLNLTRNSPEGRAFAQACMGFGMDVVPVEPNNRNSRIALRGRIEWDIESIVVGTIEAAFEKMHDEMMERIQEDVNVKLQYLKMMTQAPLSLPTERDIESFGKKM